MRACDGRPTPHVARRTAQPDAPLGCAPADTKWEPGWRVTVKHRSGGSSAGTTDAVSSSYNVSVFD